MTIAASRNFSAAASRSRSDRNLASLAADDASDTMAWLQALKDLPVERQPLWQLCRSAYLMHDGRHAEGEAIIREVLRSIGPAAVGGSYERWARELLAGPKK